MLLFDGFGVAGFCSFILFVCWVVFKVGSRIVGKVELWEELRIGIKFLVGFLVEIFFFV